MPAFGCTGRRCGRKRAARVTTAVRLAVAAKLPTAATAAVAAAGLTMVAAAGFTAVAAAEAQAPIVAYVDAPSGALRLYDAQTKQPVPAPSLSIGGAVKHFATSQNGRYVVYVDGAGKLRLWDRGRLVDVVLPGINVATGTPDSVTVSNTGVIGFDDNGNPPVRVYSSGARAFVNTGLAAANHNRQPRLSGDGRFLATTCNTNCDPPANSGSDAYVQDLATRTNVPFPDDISGSDQRDEEHPCLNGNGSLAALNITNPMQTDIFMYDRAAQARVPLPGINNLAKNDLDCVLTRAGDYVGFDSASGFKLYSRATSSFVALPAGVTNAAAARPSGGSLSDPYPLAGRDSGSRRPVIAYVEAASGQLRLYDAQRQIDLGGLAVPQNLTRWAVSLDGRYVVYSDPATRRLHLLDRTSGQQLPLPGIAVYQNPGSLSVSDSGLIAFDDNGNGPARVYSSTLRSFVSTGLSGDNGQRQPRISGDGSILATTCLDSLSPCVTPSGGDSDVYLQSLTTATTVPFPDDLSGQTGVDENRPCTDAKGTLIGFDVRTSNQTNVLVYDRTSGKTLPLPGLNSPTADESNCVLDSAGQFVGTASDAGQLRVYSRSGHGFLMLPPKVAAPAWFIQPPTGTASVSGSQLTFQAGAGVSNHLMVSRAANLFTLLDTGAPITAGAGCTNTRYDTVTCPAGGVSALNVTLGDQNDVATIAAATPALVHGNGGNDVITGGPAADTLYGDDGDDTLSGGSASDILRGGTGDDALLARDGIKDTEITCATGAADRADIDVVEVGTTSGCETVTHP